MFDYSKPFMLDNGAPATFVRKTKDGWVCLKSPFFGDDQGRWYNEKGHPVNPGLPSAMYRPEKERRTNIGDMLVSQSLHMLHINEEGYRKATIIYEVLGTATARVSVAWLKPGEQYDKYKGAITAFDYHSIGASMIVPIVEEEFVDQLRYMFMLPIPVYATVRIA